MNKFIKSIIFSLLIIIALILAHNFNLLNPIENTFFWLTKPVQQPLYNISQKLFHRQADQDLATLQSENAELNNKIKQLINENSRLASLADQYQELDQQFQYLQTKEYRSLPASVIAQSTDQASQSIIINQGSNQGIIEGLPVIVDQGYLIGKIDSVEKNRSTVVLITDNFCQFTAKIQSREQASGVTRGQHGLSLNLELIHKTEEIKIGDVVVTAGLEENVPSGLIIGQIEQVDSPAGELWQTAILNVLFNLPQTSVVSVILPS